MISYLDLFPILGNEKYIFNTKKQEINTTNGVIIIVYSILNNDKCIFCNT